MPGECQARHVFPLQRFGLSLKQQVLYLCPSNCQAIARRTSLRCVLGAGAFVIVRFGLV
jgi:hypothetical protein